MSTITYTFNPTDTVFWLDESSKVIHPATVKTAVAHVTAAGSVITYAISMLNAPDTLVREETLYADADAALAAYKTKFLL